MDSNRTYEKVFEYKIIYEDESGELREGSTWQAAAYSSQVASYSSLLGITDHTSGKKITTVSVLRE
jgi:hypothetical protein